jgi:putative salt-induced outer membrane protein YdiY
MKRSILSFSLFLFLILFSSTADTNGFVVGGDQGYHVAPEIAEAFVGPVENLQYTSSGGLCVAACLAARTACTFFGGDALACQLAYELCVFGCDIGGGGPGPQPGPDPDPD